MIHQFRIGNFINNTEVNDGFFRIEEIKKNQQDNLAVYYRNGSCMSIDPEPIPLTEEILLKCGFEKELDNSMVKNNVAIFLDKRFKTNLFLKDNQENKWHSINIKIKYLHKLQNLYFALTNEELEINL